MTRVAVIGCGGSGKSTFAHRLGWKIGLPVVHLDRHYWQEGWIEPSPTEWATKHRELCKAPKWIMDGNYGGTMEERFSFVDTVIFLDMSTWTCASSALSRALAFRGKTRPGMTPNCPERMTWEFFNYILQYRKTRRAGIFKRLVKLKSYQGIVVLNSRAAAQNFLDQH